jgi:hypothetical protein
MSAFEDKLQALYGHWVVADAIRYAARRSNKAIPKSLSVVDQHSRFMVVQVWYALLYVVVEGYRDFQLSDPDIDALLAQTEMVNALRLFRNSMFHPQENPLSEKHTKFLYRERTEVWIRQLDRAFERYLEQTSPVKERVERAKATLRQHGMKL